MKSLFLYLIKDPNVQGTRLAGLTPLEWLMRGAGDIPYRVIGAEAEILPAEGCDYLAMLYESTPLVRAEDLYALAEEIELRGADGISIGRGRLQKTEAFLRGWQPKRRCAASFATEISRAENLFSAERTLYRRNAEKSAQNGAIIPDPEAVRIDAHSTVEAGVILEPYVSVTRSVLRKGARIGSFSEVENSEIGEDAVLSRSVVKDSRIGAGATVGPFAYIRMDSEIGKGCRIGDFVEVKRSTLEEGVKAAHLTYIGDASVGAKTNVGCGTVFANYDGKEKHRTEVGRSVFIGANANLVAPLSIGDGAYIAAATTVTKEVAAGAFVIGRVRAEEKKRE